MRCRGAPFFSRETPTSYLELYASLTVPDRSASDRRILLTFSHPAGAATSMRKRLRAQEEEEKKHRARRGDRNHILHYDTADESRTRGSPQPPIARCALTSPWCHSVFPFWKGRYPWSRHLPTLCSAAPGEDESRSSVSLGCRAEFFFSGVPSNVAEGMNPKITL